ncbi:MAG: hypothetical protein U0836_14010 [Pirellulales bacterium]
MIGLGAGPGGVARSQPVEILGSPTALTSTSDRIISYRHQEHSWQTADGALHIIINCGAQSRGASLVLYSSFDGGTTWQAMTSFAGSDRTSTCDGELVGGQLLVVYPDNSDDLRLADLSYNAGTRQWSFNGTQFVAKSALVKYLNPALTKDARGRTWCAYVLQNPRTSSVEIRLSYQPAGATSWSDTRLTFGVVGSGGVKRSARPVQLLDGVGMAYSVDASIYWAKRLDEWSEDSAWAVSTIFTGQPDADPYASHFSVATDAFGNVHLAAVDAGRVVYARLLRGELAWRPAVELTGFAGANYVQTSLCSGNLVVIGNTSDQTLRLYQSSDAGGTFAYTGHLSHAPAPAGSNISYDLPRLEAPGLSSSPLPVFQQYQQGTTEKLLFFSAPVLAAQN